MTTRERMKAILNYENYDALPILHFFYWVETVDKWVKEGHLKAEDVAGILDDSDADRLVGSKLGFDQNYLATVHQKSWWYEVPLFPAFKKKVLEVFPDGHRNVLDEDGVIVYERDGATSISAEIDHTLVDRKSWETHYLPKLQFSNDRIDFDALAKLKETNETRTDFRGLYCGSLYGKLRNYWGIENLSFLYVDDEDLFAECIDTIGELSYQMAKAILETGVKLDFAHFWEDICFRTGPLVSPKVFKERVIKHYKKITELCHQHGITLISVDCDGYVDDLVPLWLEAGVNIMFPIEYGAWEYSFETMRKKFGKEIRGVGNMNKHVFAHDKAEVDKEIERLKPLVDLGGFIPCPDHRIAPDAKWELVQYYCERMRRTFGG